MHEHYCIFVDFTFTLLSPQSLREGKQGVDWSNIGSLGSTGSSSSSAGGVHDAAIPAPLPAGVPLLMLVLDAFLYAMLAWYQYCAIVLVLSFLHFSQCGSGL